MRLHPLWLAAATANLLGCGTAERQQIRRVAHLAPPGGGALLGGMQEVAPPAPVHGGVWLTRFVEKPDAFGGDRALEGIEILFCPSVESEVTHCRVGVAWSRRNHPMTERPRPAPSQPPAAQPPAAQPPAAASPTSAAPATKPTTPTPPPGTVP